MRLWDEDAFGEDTETTPRSDDPSQPMLRSTTTTATTAATTTTTTSTTTTTNNNNNRQPVRTLSPLGDHAAALTPPQCA